MPEFQSERRQFVRVRTEIPVRYKFIPVQPNPDPRFDLIQEGATQDLGAGGLLLTAKIPTAEWISDLLMQKIAVGINLYLPQSEMPIKALTRVAWMEPIEPDTLKTALGLKFREITSADRDKIFQFVIRAQLPS